VTVVHVATAATANRAVTVAIASHVVKAHRRIVNRVAVQNNSENKTD
jgi:hypothetical protein